MASPYTRAFTLTELLVVLAVIAILSALSIPVIQQMQSKAHEANCISNLRQIALAMNLWASDNNGRLPAQTSPSDGLQWNNPGGEFFEYMLNKAGVADNWDELTNTVLRCPGSNTEGTPDGERDNSYGRNSHLGIADYAIPNMQFYETPKTRIQFPSRAALVADWPLPNFQRYTLNSEERINNLWSRHNGSMKVAYVDGHVGSITRQQWEAWTTASAGSQEQSDFRVFLYRDGAKQSGILERFSPNSGIPCA